VYEAIPIIDGDLDVPKLVNVIVPARLPSIPSKPNKIQLIVIAITGGIVIGFILVFAMEFFDHSLKESRDVEKYLKLPVAGRIPRIEFKKRKNKKS
jgi:capsular polysaccharide biosynthesis protein